MHKNQVTLITQGDQNNHLENKEKSGSIALTQPAKTTVQPKDSWGENHLLQARDELNTSTIILSLLGG